MIKIEFKNSYLEFHNSISASDIALKISENLLKNSIACKVNGKIKDLSFIIESDSKISFLTNEDKQEESLDILRHSCAHLLADALTELFPDIKLTVGPVIKDGFYYDFFLKDYNVSVNDFEKIENKMHEIASRNKEIKKTVHSKNEALKIYRDNNFKQEILQGIPEKEEISIYHQGDFFDVCRGPHLPNTSFLKHFKLLKVSGSYFKGDQKRESLQRIYGTCFFEEKNLIKHTLFLEEAKKRDHRKIGKDLDLFHQQEEAKGDIFWHKNGTLIYNTIETYIRKKLNQNDYQEVKTPQIVDKSLWEKSGHLDKFGHNMILTQAIREDELLSAVKPMNCPCHIQIFNDSQTSYKDLPIRMAEFGKCHRYEPSGSLHGIMRLRSFTQDDAHIFCTIDQIGDEIKNFIILLKLVYEDFGFKTFTVKLSDRPDLKAGSEEVWDLAENKMHSVLKELNIDYTVNKGEGAFYGPKYEFVLQDALGRDWQCGTLQLDFVLPERLGAFYIDSDNEKKHPVMIHRAILGSIERFIAILLENYEGNLPLWLAPIQVAIIGVNNSFDDYIKNLVVKFQNHGIRVISDLSPQTISYKIRDLSVKKVKFIITVGQKEIDSGLLSIRQIGSEKQTQISFNDFVSKFTWNL